MLALRAKIFRAAGLRWAWRDAVTVVAMDGFTIFEAPSLAFARPVSATHLAGHARASRHIRGPLLSCPSHQVPGACLLTKKQQAWLDILFTVEEHEVEASWGIYQRVIAAYREPDKTKSKQMMQAGARLRRNRRPHRPHRRSDASAKSSISVLRTCPGSSTTRHQQPPDQGY